ncbi:accessory Sec system glycosylation chaperone GtfB [Staphylococcus intermedius]|uniref:UDP-N-acetylglucosamine--peptide N-acetylglucosaminyltransferase stabilizing protein GtfB n=1 Tax=Staphylococcus intermedius NCTC 11048 TaxID=1141106 RepID=A0A380G5A3_STAIN|nr:accessory Sec system glycosylation chaperone GtfB [Staphylococcus intermedius]PCF64055.1 accessory Sec system glycosylation chaperone GtfB [Staphylococcus intermedius]PCF78770.1 accessory Sec system glycosylation chaperone GtfB [Staphylococcus intermedius]PCF79743.1 accessory Sec system glycosylation chaperone GtfB [Staphylococcus intermedius]PCF85907.1 accessory Sec system glycosylation chaperone GtfB [Staphylococcus intermedius]PCF89598.1 accessory Sec system glycosylation chaperone GtfB 
MVNLFEQFDAGSQELYQTLKLAGHDDETIVLIDDGFLPEGIISPYSFFADYKAPKKKRARFFNEVPMPRFWEIEGNNEEAWIKDMSYKRAHIHFQSGAHRRIISHIDWLDQHGNLQFVNHYNQHGLHFAQTVYDLNGKMIFRRYLDQQGNEVIYENFIASSIILTWKGQYYHFNSQTAFLVFFLKQLGVDLSGFVINSLGLPFAVLYQLDVPGKDTLFWQESSQGEIPGNMRLILEGNINRDCRVLIPSHKEYEIINEQLNDEQREHIAYSGYLYEYQSKNEYSANILTMTNSDQITNLVAMIEACPFATFHIGAVTEMSTVLTSLDVYKNVKLYETIETETIEKLYHKCDVYLDINEGGEIVNAVRKAFDYDMLIMGYEDIAHNRTYTAPENLFTKENQAADLIQAVKDVHLKKRYFKVRKDYQQKHANETTVEAFNAVYQS